MKKIFMIFLLLLGFTVAADEMSPMYKFTWFGDKDYCNTIGIIFDYPFAEDNNKYFITESIGCAFTKQSIGLDVESYVGKQFRYNKAINKFGLCCGVITMIQNQNCNTLLHIDALYDLNYILDENSYIPIYIGFVIKGGCGYKIKNDVSEICPIISGSIAIGLLL